MKSYAEAAGSVYSYTAFAGCGATVKRTGMLGEVESARQRVLSGGRKPEWILLHHHVYTRVGTSAARPSVSNLQVDTRLIRVHDACYDRVDLIQQTSNPLFALSRPIKAVHQEACRTKKVMPKPW